MMVERYFKLIDFVRKLSKDNKELIALMLSAADELLLTELQEDLVKLSSVTTALQSTILFAAFSANE